MSFGAGVCVDVRRALSAGARGRPFATGLKTVPPFSVMLLVTTTCKSYGHSRTRVDIVLQLNPIFDQSGNENVVDAKGKALKGPSNL